MCINCTYTCTEQINMFVHAYTCKPTCSCVKYTCRCTCQNRIWKFKCRPRQVQCRLHVCYIRHINVLESEKCQTGGNSFLGYTCTCTYMYHVKLLKMFASLKSICMYTCTFPYSVANFHINCSQQPKK